MGLRYGTGWSAETPETFPPELRFIVSEECWATYLQTGKLVSKLGTAILTTLSTGVGENNRTCPYVLFRDGYRLRLTLSSCGCCSHMNLMLVASALCAPDVLRQRAQRAEMTCVSYHP